MIAVFETFDPIQADIVKTHLEQSGIPAHIQSSDVGGMRPSLAFVSPFKILVPERQIEEARKIIQDLESLNEN